MKIKRVWMSVIAVLLLLLPSIGFAAKVEVKPLSEKSVYPQLSAPAEVVSYKNSQLGSEVAGKVIEVARRVGESVKQGDLLLRIDPTNYRLSLKQLQAARQSLQAKIKFARYQLELAKRLGSQRNVSEELVLQRQSEVDSLKAELMQQQVAIERAETDLQRTELRAPFAGVVIKRLINEGEWADPGAPLFQLLATNAVEVMAQLHPQDVAQLSAAKMIRFSTALKNYPVELRVLLPLLDSRQRTQEVRLTFKGEPALAGSSGRLEWLDERPHLPANLLLRREGKLGLFIAQEGLAHFIALPQAQEGRAVLVTHLPADTLIVLEGRDALQEGDSLEIQ